MKNEVPQRGTQACCAHRNVEYVRIEHPGGTCSDSWRCTMCHVPFWPSVPAVASESETAICPTCGSHSRTQYFCRMPKHGWFTFTHTPQTRECSKCDNPWHDAKPERIAAEVAPQSEDYKRGQADLFHRMLTDPSLTIDDQFCKWLREHGWQKVEAGATLSSETPRSKPHVSECCACECHKGEHPECGTEFTRRCKRCPTCQGAASPAPASTPDDDPSEAMERVIGLNPPRASTSTPRDNTTTIPGGGVQDPSRNAQIVGAQRLWEIIHTAMQKKGLSEEEIFQRVEDVFSESTPAKMSAQEWRKEFPCNIIYQGYPEGSTCLDQRDWAVKNEAPYRYTPEFRQRHIDYDRTLFCDNCWSCIKLTAYCGASPAQTVIAADFAGLQPLIDACDRRWTSESASEVVAIAANALHWRKQRAEAAEKELAELKASAWKWKDANLATLSRVAKKLKEEYISSGRIGQLDEADFRSAFESALPPAPSPYEVKYE
jgi:hypothetical protein